MKFLRTLFLAVVALALPATSHAVWSVIHDTDFSGISNTSAVSSGSTLVDGWIDTGGTWTVNSGKAVDTWGPANGYYNNHLLRPTGENARDARVVARVASGDLGSMSFMIVLRESSGNFILLQATAGNIYTMDITGGSNISNLQTIGWGTSYNPAHVYDIDFSATGTGTTTVTVTVTDVTASTTVASHSGSVTDAALQGSGQMGVSLSSGGPIGVSRITTYQDAALSPGTITVGSATVSSLVVSRGTSPSGGTSPYTTNLYRSTTNGFTPGGGNLIASGVTLPYTDSGLTINTTYYYVGGIADSGSLTGNTPQASGATLSAPPTLVSGALSFSSATASTVVLACTAATGGTPSYTYAVHRATTADFTPTSGNRIATGVSFPYTDSSPLSGLAYYKVVTADAGVQTATSNVAVGSPWLNPLKLGFIGDSLTEGGPASTHSVDVCVAKLQQLRKQRSVTGYNQGHSGSKTQDWLPSSGTGYLTAAKAAFAAAGVTHVPITLGTNNSWSGDPSTTTYLSHMTTITSNLVSSGYIVILNYPPFATPGAGGIISENSDEVMRQYQAAIDSLVNGTTILQGDKLAYEYFAQHQSELTDGIHCTDTGANSQGMMWAAAIDRALNPSTGSAVPFGYAF